MKTKIITLESHDDLISVRDKLSWAKTPRILLVWPKYENVTLRLLDLKVLQRHADSLGAQLGLVTRRNNVRRDAESLNIPVFDSTTSAQKDAWLESPPRKRRIPKPPQVDLRKRRDEIRIQEPAWIKSLLGRIILFSIGVLSVLVLAGIFIPRAQVTLLPESKVVSAVIPVQAGLSFNSVSLNGDIPAQEISVTVDVQKTKPITSRIAIPKTKAKGFVQFQNLSSSEVTIPAGTIVATNDAIRFETLNRAVLPGGVNQIVEVPIQAMNAGEVGNINAETILSIEGPLGLLMTVTNPESTSGGEDENVIGANENDRTLLREDVLNELRLKAEVEIRSQIAEKDFLLIDTIELTEILFEEFSPSENVASDMLNLTIQADFSARYLLADDIQALTNSYLLASIPEDFVTIDEINFDLLDTPFTDSDGVTRFQLQVSQNTVKQVDVLQVFNLIRGHDLQNAKTKLKNVFTLREEPQITISPSWWSWMPLIPFNISVEVK
ncbi:MAG: baseplate J/gp47 family protein [Anaerolineales bacterium]|nr:baseplate J/gp47 family protein [Anaerolineales bacterium]